ncbi:Coiled-coil domain-containing protein 63 [Taenia solium]|eukprot:TsM_000245500 transcript=TsM_000245500 gene=TsM_000245500
MPYKSMIETDAEVLAEREAEYIQLKHALHLAQADRQHYIEEMQSAMSKMKKIIEKLEAERNELLEQISVVDSKVNQAKDQRTCEDLANLADNKDWLQQQIAQEKAKHVELDVKTRELEKNLWSLIHTAGTTQGAQEAMSKLRKKQACLESRVVHALKTYNDALGKNMRLRSEIDTLRMERGRFDLIYRKIDLTLTKMRNEISRLTSFTTQAYDQREEAAQRIQALTDKAEKDNQQHNIEMKELVRLIDHERKLKQFMKIKAAEREEDPQLSAWRAKKEAEAEEKREQVEQTIRRYEESFDRMLVLAKTSTTDKLVDSFLFNEDRNFALFNYVSEINGEIEKLLNENEEIKKQIDDYRNSMNNTITEKRQELENLESTNKKIEEATERIRAKLAKTKQLLQETAVMTGDLAERLNCDTSVLERRLAASENPTLETVLDYLALIEERIDDLLLVRQYIATIDADAPYIAKPILMGGNLLPLSSSLPTIIPPNLNADFDESAGEGELKVPLSREELHKRVISQMKSKHTETTGKETDVDE